MKIILLTLVVAIGLLCAASAMAQQKVVIIPLSGSCPECTAPNQECQNPKFLLYLDGTGYVRCSTNPESKTVFITSDTFDGNLGGVAGADQKCQTIANYARLPGVYKAWVGDTSSTPSSRFTHSTVPYVLTDGTQIASDWADLTDGTLANSINSNEFGDVYISAKYSWTGLAQDGVTLAKPRCTDWTSSAGSQYGEVGHSNYTNSWWSQSAMSLCNNLMHLYCFQQ